MSGAMVAMLGLAGLLLWSGLVVLLARWAGPGHAGACDPAGEDGGLLWLAAILVGLVLTLLWGEFRVAGVPVAWATALPIAIAYSDLLFHLGRPHPDELAVPRSEAPTSMTSEDQGLEVESGRTVSEANG